MGQTEYKNTMNYERTWLYSVAAARVMAHHGFRVLDVFPATAVGEALLVRNDIRHYTAPMYTLWANQLAHFLCGEKPGALKSWAAQGGGRRNR